jgi:hypothetical protein
MLYQQGFVVGFTAFCVVGQKRDVIYLTFPISKVLRFTRHGAPFFHISEHKTHLSKMLILTVIVWLSYITLFCLATICLGRKQTISSSSPLPLL